MSTMMLIWYMPENLLQLPHKANAFATLWKQHSKITENTTGLVFFEYCCNKYHQLKYQSLCTETNTKLYDFGCKAVTDYEQDIASSCHHDRLRNMPTHHISFSAKSTSIQLWRYTDICYMVQYEVTIIVALPFQSFKMASSFNISDRASPSPSIYYAMGLYMWSVG